MRNERRGPTGWLVAGLAMFATIGLSQTANTSEPCCFTNDRYSGVCRVVPGQDETCTSILRYLNNPNSTGKNYCDNTAVRGGWSKVKCGGTAAAP